MSDTNNAYDRTDRVRLIKKLHANGLKIAAYTVLDPETGEHTGIQYHMTYDNHVMAVMSEGAAKLFASFVNDFDMRSAA